jgi:lipopolysaccharide/colanic/teichoic acid biosynthesis glycosyltransferase
MLKRALDLFISITGLVLVAPLLLVLAVLIAATSPGPIIYQTKRIGQHGRLFTLYKLRTMVSGADRAGPGVTGAQDPRVTPVGRFLRLMKFDELPQLFNVLRGDMSLVGPRPEDPRYVVRYMPEQWRVLSIRPGITSLACIRYRHEETMLSAGDWETQYLNDVLPKKLQLDLLYVQTRTLLLDLKILAGTIFAVVRA